MLVSGSFQQYHCMYCDVCVCVYFTSKLRFLYTENVRAGATHFDKTAVRLRKTKQRRGWKVCYVMLCYYFIMTAGYKL